MPVICNNKRNSIRLSIVIRKLLKCQDFTENVPVDV